MAEELSVWLDGEEIAVLDQPRWPSVRCRYTSRALDRWPANSPLISCSLPLVDRPQDATAFCAGLLPEGRALEVMAREANIPTNENLELLARYGRDIAGALTISTTPPEPRRYGLEPYDDAKLADAVRNLDYHPLGADDESELSLAGLQDKLLLVRTDDGWARPLRGRPSTHILKLDDRRFPGLVAAEADCLDLARAIGLTTIDVEITRVGDADCLIVSRFDRRESGEKIVRIHQEDVCQASGIDARDQRGRAKYERAGGPSLRALAELLDTYAVDQVAQLERLVAVVTFTVAIGNADAHGKNLALLHPTPGTIELAPVYDTVPTMLWPSLRTEAAMSVGGAISLPDVSRTDIIRETRNWPLASSRVEAVVTATAEGLLSAVKAGKVAEDSPVARLVWDRAARLVV